MFLDIAVLVVLIISAGIAFFRGFIREALTIVGVVGGAVAAIYGSPHLTPMIADMMGGDVTGRVFGVVPVSILAPAVSYGGLFLLVVGILSFISHLISRAVTAVGMGPVDRTVGVIFGLGRGLILLSILYLPFYLLTDNATRDEWFGGSKSRIYVEGTSKWLASLMPDSAKSDIASQAAAKAAEAQKTIGQKARERMKDMDILSGSGTASPVVTPSNNTTKSENGTGYEDEQIRALDQIIQEQFQNGQYNE